MAVRNGQLNIPELHAEVIISYDKWGVPAIAAENNHDLAFAMGWVHANDRMEQMELTRLAVQGRLAEVLGPQLIDRDLNYRHMRIPHTARHLASIASLESKRWLNAYAEGVNAWLSQRADDLPPLYQLTGWKPEKWQARDSLGIPLLMALDLSRGFGPSEMQRLQTLQGLGAKRFFELWGDMHLADGIIDYPLPVAQEKVNHDHGASARGSNHWVVGPSRTITGSALLANDPHLNLQLPSIWYQALLRAPNFSVAGMSFPGTPGIVIGHNQNIAWGFTNSQLDDNDVFLEKFNPEKTAVLRGEQWELIQSTQETLKVKGQEDLLIELRSTKLGPLLPENKLTGFPERTLVWTAYKDCDFTKSFIKFATAKTLEDSHEAAKSFLVPSQNIVIADRQGNIMHAWTGQLPMRQRGDGRLPSPGWDLSYQWSGLWPSGSGAYSKNPQSGVLATANHDTRPHDQKAGFSGEFGQNYRFQQITDRCLERDDWDVKSLGTIQHDSFDGWAKDICDALVEHFDCSQHELGDSVSNAISALNAWDKRMELGGASALFRLFRLHLSKSLFRDDDRLGNLPNMPSFFRRPHILAAVRGQLNPDWYDDRQTTNHRENLDDILLLALKRAMQEGCTQWGDNIDNWNYGDIHNLTLHNPLSYTPLIGSWWDRGPFPVTGSPTSIGVMAGPWREGMEHVVAGPSFRMVCDTANWDNSSMVMPGGQSGHPADYHYDDQLEILLRGESRQFNWSEAAIEKTTVSRLTLKPTLLQ